MDLPRCRWLPGRVEDIPSMARRCRVMLRASRAPDRLRRGPALFCLATRATDGLSHFPDILPSGSQGGICVFQQTCRHYIEKTLYHKSRIRGTRIPLTSRFASSAGSFPKSRSKGASPRPTPDRESGTDSASGAISCMKTKIGGGDLLCYSAASSCLGSTSSRSRIASSGTFVVPRAFPTVGHFLPE